MQPLDGLPQGIRSRIVAGVNGLAMHVLEAGEAGRPALLLLHGFPELAYSWRKVMPALAAAGFHVIAPDQRGYGRTTGWSADYDADTAPFRMPNLVRDQLALLHALGIARVQAVIGHDFGSPVAACCALIRPDIFARVAMMSSPFAGAPRWDAAPRDTVHEDLAALDPARKHYQWYYATREANDDMLRAKQGLHDFLRAYYHHKSADWPENRPFELAGWTAAELAKLPTYYVMHAAETMAETVAPHMPHGACAWLTEAELDVYAAEYARTGFQGGLNWYRCQTGGGNAAELRLFSGLRISVPSLFVAGAADWGIHQFPGALRRMREEACKDMRGVHLVPGAGHWVQQERPEAVIRHLLDFLRATG
ncbi:alpha/beta hydrolase [Falsiroseomonas bella]|uniref:Alpha/beta hydrolase n=1 Tax=Falsiroseomonas bella TaxID=2184016 RepID=A0A317FH92_9PROT|nr:alpha/beta hydrolase [Falsiroseomonas bella]PWS37953.1 alpha/beta hydrolase [Falsiroseomonas bella]